MIIGANGRPDSIAALPDLLQIEDNALVHPVSGEDFTEQTRVALGILKTFNLFDISITPDMWVMDNTYSQFPYRASIAIAELTPQCYVEVSFNLADSKAGWFAPLCESLDGELLIYSVGTPTTVIPAILCTEIGG